MDDRCGCYRYKIQIDMVYVYCKSFFCPGAWRAPCTPWCSSCRVWSRASARWWHDRWTVGFGCDSLKAKRLEALNQQSSYHYHIYVQNFKLYKIIQVLNWTKGIQECRLRCFLGFRISLCYRSGRLEMIPAVFSQFSWRQMKVKVTSKMIQTIKCNVPSSSAISIY